MVYAFGGFLSFVLWLFAVTLILVPAVGLGPAEVYEFMWIGSVPPVRFIMVDMIGMWLSCMIYVCYHKPAASKETLGMCFLFGPGAGVCMALAGMETEIRNGPAQNLAIQSKKDN